MHWHWNYAVGILLVPVYIGCSIYSMMLRGEMTNKLNAVLPKDEQFEWLGWGYEKRQRFERLYRRHFPNDALRWRCLIHSVLGAVAFVAMMVTFTFREIV